MGTANASRPHLGVSLAARGYAIYARELHALHTVLTRFCALPSAPLCLSCTIELELSYMRLRDTKPAVVWEISPASGFSTLMLLHALHENGKEGAPGRLHSTPEQQQESSARCQPLRISLRAS